MTLEQVRDWHRQQSKLYGYWAVQRSHEQMADAIDAHLLSQDTEIERLSQESAQQFIRARDWAELSGKNEDRASLAESRLAAANALLRECYGFMESQSIDQRSWGETLSLGEKIDAHLSENAHDRA
jgi:hypothetical protein